jgi:hypothetical protein
MEEHRCHGLQVKITFATLMSVFDVNEFERFLPDPG